MFPPRSRIGRSLDALKPGADSSFPKIQVLDGNFFPYNPVSSTLKTRSGGKSLSSLIFQNLAVNMQVLLEPSNLCQQ